MKTKLLFSSLLMSASLLAGFETGNGGDVVICDLGNGKKSYELLDYYEGRVNFRKDVDLSKGKTAVEKAQKIVQKMWVSLGEERYEQYMKIVNTFMSEATFVKKDLKDIPDHGAVYLESGCVIKQAVVQYPDYKNNVRKYEIDERIWDKLSEVDKAGMILHEVAYNEMRGLGEKDSRFARRFNYEMASGKFPEYGSLGSSRRYVFDEIGLSEKCEGAGRSETISALSSIKLKWGERFCVKSFISSLRHLDHRGTPTLELFEGIWSEVDLSIISEMMWTIHYNEYYLFGREMELLKSLPKNSLFVKGLQQAYFELTDLEDKARSTAILGQFPVSYLDRKTVNDIAENLYILQDELEKECFSSASYRCMYERIFMGPFQITMNSMRKDRYTQFEKLLNNMTRPDLLGYAMTHYLERNYLDDEKLTSTLAKYLEKKFNRNMFMSLMKRLNENNKKEIENLFLENIKSVFKQERYRSKRPHAPYMTIRNAYGYNSYFYDYNFNKVITKANLPRLKVKLDKKSYLALELYVQNKESQYKKWGQEGTFLMDSLTEEGIKKGLEMLRVVPSLLGSYYEMIIKLMFTQVMKSMEGESLAAISLGMKVDRVSSTTLRDLKILSETDRRASVRAKAKQILKHFSN